MGSPPARTFGLLVLLGAAPVGQDQGPATRPAAPASVPTSVPASTPASGPASRAASAPDPEARALARLALEHAGGQGGLDQVESLVFSSQQHRTLWSRRESRVRTELLGEPGPVALGTRWLVLVHDTAANQSLLQLPVPNPQAPKISARSMWIEDTFRLLLPLRVLDEHVALAIDPPDAGDPPGVRRLRLKLPAATSPPSGDYILHVDARSGRIDRCDAVRERGRAASWTLGEWTRIGPLRLPLRWTPVEPAGRTPRAFQFTDVAANVAVPKDAWTREGRFLDTLGVGGAGR